MVNGFYFHRRKDIVVYLIQHCLIETFPAAEVIVHSCHIDPCQTTDILAGGTVIALVCYQAAGALNEPGFCFRAVFPCILFDGFHTFTFNSYDAGTGTPQW